MGATAKQAKTTFKVGDKAVYPAHGVGVIEAIENKQIGGAKHKFYMLRILENDMTIMIPLGNVDAVGLRTVIDRKMVSRINRILREQDIRIDTQTWNRRYREYTEKIKTGSVLEIAEVLRDLCVLKRKKKELSFGERKMLDTARSLLVKEISIAKGMKEADVMTDLERVLGEGHVGNGNGNGKVNGQAADGEVATPPVSVKAPAASARPPAAPKVKPVEKTQADKPKAMASAKPAEPSKAAKSEAKPKAPTKAKPAAKAKTAQKSKANAPAKPKAKAPAKPKAKAPAAKKAKAADKGAAAAGAGTRAAAKKSSASTAKKGGKAAPSKARRKK